MNRPVLRAALVGGVAGAAATFAVVALSAAVLVRVGSKRFPAMMARMMSEGGSERMRACMERCGCLPASGDAAE